MTIRKNGNGITYWSAESGWHSADKHLFQQGKLALNITRDYYLLQKRQDKPTDPITYDLAPLNGPVHVGDIVAVRLAVSGTDWKYLLAEDPIPAGTEFLGNSGLYRSTTNPIGGQNCLRAKSSMTTALRFSILLSTAAANMSICSRS